MLLNKDIALNDLAIPSYRATHHPRSCYLQDSKVPANHLFSTQKKEFIEVKKRTKEEVDEQDIVFDFVDFRGGAERLGWLVTYSAITVTDAETGAELSGK
jgi:hypothetical protein